MGEAVKRERVLLLTGQYRILGELSRDGESREGCTEEGARERLRRSGEQFITVYEAQFLAADGKPVFDVERAEVNRDAVVAVFRESEIAFMRKDQP